MANIGDRLTSPEVGWKRIDDINSNITYNSATTSVSMNQAFGGSYHNCSYTETGDIKFNITGDKLRIIGVLYKNGSSDIVIEIDNTIYNFSQFSSSTVYQCLNYEIKDLLYKEHSIHIYNSSGILYLDAIDIDENGELKPYNLFKYLIKQQDKYYSIKPEFYQDGQFTPLTLSDGDKPNDDDYNNQGFDDINTLCTDMTVGIDTFKPIDKLQDQFQIKKYIPN
ncbi:cell adhesion protein [Clostridium sp. MT-14]|uniref:cell adhesion protein n=1 Tax=Clostridium sp. MT-14 TaxID=3348360 RepID=UPI0035F2E72D